MLYSRFLLVIYFMYSTVYTSMPISHGLGVLIAMIRFEIMARSCLLNTKPLLFP